MRDKDALSRGAGREGAYAERGDGGDQEAKEAKEEVLDSAIESILNEAYGKFTQQLGHRTDGHQCVTNRDREEAASLGASLLYGEVLPQGVSKLLDAQHLNAADASVLYDFGMGTGKLALQAFLQVPSLRRVVGVELAQSRYSLGEDALLSVVNRYPTEFSIVHWTKDESIRIATTRQRRTLEFRRANMLSLPDHELASIDIAIMETDVPQEIYAALSAMVCKLGNKARLLSYLNLCKVWLGPVFPFEQLPVNRGPEDRFLTSWSSKRGHHFYLWTKTTPPFDWHEACATTLDTRSRNRTVRRIGNFFSGFRYGFGRAGKQRRKMAEETRRRSELERRSAAATARALALQRSARKTLSPVPGAVQRNDVALTVAHTHMLHLQAPEQYSSTPSTRKSSRGSTGSRRHGGDAGAAGQVVQGTYYADATLSRGEYSTDSVDESGQRAAFSRGRPADSARGRADDKPQGAGELRHSTGSAHASKHVLSKAGKAGLAS